MRAVKIKIPDSKAKFIYYYNIISYLRVMADISKSIKLSVIIPAYKEEKNIGSTIKNVAEELKKLPFESEVIIVVDGSPDNTETVAQKAAKAYPFVKVRSYTPNRGKGYALTYGVRRAHGELVTLFDAGGDYHPDHIDRYVKLLEAFDADMVVGSKLHPASNINYPFKRRVMSRVYRTMNRILFNIDVKDTQTGLKLAKAKVLDNILPRVVVKQYAFDLELLVLAKKLGYRRIFEAPVNLDFNAIATGIRTKTIIKMLQDTLGIWYRLKITHYYDKKHNL